MSDSPPINKQSQAVSDPKLSDLLNLHKKEIKLEINCHAIATVQSFNKDTQTVTATINYKKTFYRKNADGVYENFLQDYATLVDCPVIVLSGGSSYLNVPIQSGDTCLILFNDRDMDNWHSAGQIGPVATQRLHSFSDAIALVGLRSLKNAIDDYETTHLALKWKNGGYVGVSSSKVLIKNPTRNLNDLLQELITDVKNLVTATAAITVTCAAPASPSGPPLNAAAINAAGTALTATATKIGELLE